MSVIPLRQIRDNDHYLVALNTTESGFSKGAALKQAMRRGKHTMLWTCHSSNVAPQRGFILVMLTEELYIAVRSLEPNSDHCTKVVPYVHHEPATPSEPVEEAPKAKRSFKKLTAPEPPPAPKPAFAKLGGFKRRNA